MQTTTDEMLLISHHTCRLVMFYRSGALNMNANIMTHAVIRTIVGCASPTMLAMFGHSGALNKGQLLQMCFI